MKSHTFAAVTANGDSAVLDLANNGASWVDLFIPYLTSAGAAVEFDGGDFTFKYSVDGTNYKAVPGMTVADDETGYKGRFLVWGSNLKFTVANLAGSASTVTPVVRYKSASMVEVKDFQDPTEGVLSADAGTESVTFGRAPAKILLDAEASTWDSVDLVLQGSPDGSDYWVDMDGTHATVNDQYIVYDNPSKLTNFRWEWSGGGLSAAGFTAKLIGLSNLDEAGIKGESDVLVAAADILVTSGDGTAAADATLVDVTATWDATALGIYNDNNITIIEEVNKNTVLLGRIVDCLQANGLLPTGNA